MTNETILLVSSSSRSIDSVTRQLAEQLVAELQQQQPLSVVRRDVAEGIPLIDETWVNANFTDVDQRDQKQQRALALSDQLVAELQTAKYLVLGVPIYNFAIPASLKAWIDQIARAGLTFRYSADGPQGLLKGKRAFVVMASGGVPIGSDWDYASGYLKHLLGFVGIEDVTIIDANGLELADQAAVSIQLAAAINGESSYEQNTA